MWVASTGPQNPHSGLRHDTLTGADRPFPYRHSIPTNIGMAARGIHILTHSVLLCAATLKAEFTKVTLDLERALSALPLVGLSMSDDVRRGVVSLQQELAGAKFEAAAMHEDILTEMRRQVRWA